MSSHHLHQNDLPSNVSFQGSVAIDCEMMGLKVGRDRLCLVQLRDATGPAHLVQIRAGSNAAPNLKKLLEDRKTLKIFHFGQTDIAYLKYYLNAETAPIFDTKIAAKLARRNTDKHGLEDLCRDLLGIELSKVAQSSDWGADTLTADQMQYAARDVLHLHALMDKLAVLLRRDGMMEIAEMAFANICNNGLIEAKGINPIALFAHSSSDRI